jgi:hypothetical protein
MSMEYSEDKDDRVQSEELDDELSQVPGSEEFRGLERDLEREDAFERGDTEDPTRERLERLGARDMEQDPDEVERALREDNDWPPSGRDPRTLSDARPLNKVRQEDRGVGPLGQDNESDAPYDPYEH